MKSIHGILRKLVVAAVGAAMACATFAEDIDIYTTAPGEADRPNVLLMLDNSANWSASIDETCTYGIMKTNPDGSLYLDPVTNLPVDTGEGPKATNPGKEQGTKMAIEKCALYRVIAALPVQPDKPDDANAKFNLGMMLLNPSPSSNNGAFPLFAMLPMTTENKKALLEKIKSLTINDDKGNNAAFSKAMHEMYLYFKGMAPYKGNATVGRFDPRAFTNGTEGGVYQPTSPNSCAMNHIIFIGNGSPEGAENNDAALLLRSIGGSSTQIPTETDASLGLSPVSNSEAANWANEYALFMRNADFSSKDGTQNIITHTAALVGASSDGTFPTFMKTMSHAGGGTHVSATNAAELVSKLLDIFNSLQAKDQVFASASLPVALNARGTYLNQVYMGVFRPDRNAKQRWRGNLKQYKFAADDLGNLSLVDANNKDALVPPPIDGKPQPSTGFILQTATSFWTESSTFWSKEPMGLGLTSDSPDGEVVEKGGAAQKLRTKFLTSQADRKVYTCIGCSSGSLAQFATGNNDLKKELLALSTEDERTKLIEWIRGKDNAGDEKGPGGTTTVRPSIHGDVLHSRPAVINYGKEHGVIVYYGANDGMLHAVDGNLPGKSGTAGEELWSFVPEEVFGKLNRLRTNTPEISLTTTVLPGAKPRDYYVDGPIGVYQRIAADGSTSEATIFVSMRRGGRALYAFDVKTPTSPQLRWKFAGSDTNKNMGQSWSEPKVGRVIGDKATAAGNLVVMFGGGYDPAEDDLVPGTTTMGAAVFILDATTGTVLKEFNSSHGLTRPVVADLAVVDSDFDGKIDRAYAMDLGGGVWRIDFETADGKTSKDDWTIFKVADLSGGTTTGRKFFYAPSVVLTKDFTALMFGSGDREKPLLQTTKDHFFTVFDRNLDKGKPSTLPTPIAFDKLSPMTPTPTTLGDGCQMELAAGEKVVNGATTIGGKTHFGTNQPIKEGSTNTCIPHLGTARGYTMPLFCTAPTHTVYPGGGLPPSPIAGTVTITSADGKSSSNHHFYTGGDQACGALCPSDPKIKITAARKRIYWYQQTNR